MRNVVWLAWIAALAACGESGDREARPDAERQGELPDPSEGGNTRYDRTDPDWLGPARSVGPSSAPPPGAAPEAAPGLPGASGEIDIGSPTSPQGVGTGVGVSAGAQDRDPQEDPAHGGTGAPSLGDRGQPDPQGDR